MADNQNQDFISPQQCFIVYDDLSKKVAISIRNRLSRLGIKCTAWDKDHFEDNEYRMSNFNRILFLNSELAKDYLFNPEVKKVISDYVIYKREGRVASLTIDDNDVKFDDILEDVKKKYESMKAVADNASQEDKTLIDGLSANELAESVAMVPVSAGNKLIPEKTGTKKDESKDSKSKVTNILTKAGVGAMVFAASATFPIASTAIFTALYFYGRHETIKSTKDCKQILLLAAAMMFEDKYIDDFVRAE